jgi:hypothetical protein
MAEPDPFPQKREIDMLSPDRTRKVSMSKSDMMSGAGRSSGERRLLESAAKRGIHNQVPKGRRG